MSEEEKLIKHKEADILLNEPVIISVDIKPQGRVFKFQQSIGMRPKKRVFEIRDATLRTMIRCSKLLLDVSADEIDGDAKFLETAYQSVVDDGERMAHIVASAFHNQKSPVPESLIDFVLDNFSSPELKSVFTLVVDKLNLLDFISTIALGRNLDIMASPDEKKEIIAFSKQ